MIFLLMFVILPVEILIKIILSAVLAGFGLSIVGTFVVHMKITSVGFAMSHAAFAGAALGLLLEAYGSQLDAVYTATIFTIIIALLLGPLSNKTNLDSNVILGIIFSLMIALGFIFISLMPSGVTNARSLSIIWGSIFGLTQSELITLIFLNITIIILIILFFKEFIAIMFNNKLALAAGIHVKFFEFLILFITAIVVSLSLKIVGAFLVYAMIVNPTSTAHQFIYDTKKLFLVSPLLGIFTILGGIFLSLYADFPIASSIIIFSSIVFALAAIFSPKRRKAKKKQNSKQQNEKKNKVREYFNDIAEIWDQIVIHDPDKLEYIIDALNLSRGQKVLDVGSGTGILIPYIYKYVKNEGRIVALDISDEMIAISRKKHPEQDFPNVKHVISDVEHFKTTEKFDAILCYSCFPHFSNKEKIINHLTKLLDNEGKLMIAHSESREKINEIHKNAKSESIKGDYLPTINEISEMMEKSGLTVNKFRDDEEMFFIIGMKKEP